MVKKIKKTPSGGAGGSGFQLFDDPAVTEGGDEDELPKDEVGRQKIKAQYVDLLGIRMRKLRGRILNRERINKTLEGIYFICVRCEKVCHNLDEGLVEDPDNEQSMCLECSKLPAAPTSLPEPAARRPTSRSRPKKQVKVANKARPALSSTKTAKAAKKPIAKAKKSKKTAKSSKPR